MKKPRLPTEQELAEWRESNRGTKLQKKVAHHTPPSPAAVRPAPTQTPHGEHVSAPPKRTGLKAPLASLDAREAKRAFKPHAHIEATLDLHGLTKLEAYVRVQQFVMRAHCTGRRHVTIITGKGRAGEAGVLRTNLPHWLNEPALRPLISAFATARAEKGGHGVTHVLIKRSS